MPGQVGMERLPVFTTPQQQINFYADDPSTFRQILTIYNPYESVIKFKLFCTERNKYTVSFSQGQIKPNHTVDIVIQHKAVIPGNFGITDVIRIQVYTAGQVRSSGKRDISITLHGNIPRERSSPPSLEPEHFQQLEGESAAAAGQLRQNPLMHERNPNGNIYYGCIIFFLVGLLIMPKVGDESSIFPEFLPRPSSDFKIGVAIILGMVFTLVLRT